MSDKEIEIEEIKKELATLKDLCRGKLCVYGGIDFSGCVNVRNRMTQLERKIAGTEKRFSIDANGVITDTETGLQWFVGPDKNTDYYAAEQWVKSLGDDWRLPTIEELRELYQEGMGNRNINPVFKTTGWSVWSNELLDEEGVQSTNLDSPRARGFPFSYGTGYWHYRSYDDYGRGFAVRPGRPSGCMDGIPGRLRRNAGPGKSESPRGGAMSSKSVYTIVLIACCIIVFVACLYVFVYVVTHPDKTRMRVFIDCWPWIVTAWVAISIVFWQTEAWK